jgi:hypothetical protein
LIPWRSSWRSPAALPIRRPPGHRLEPEAIELHGTPVFHGKAARNRAVYW